MANMNNPPIEARAGTVMGPNARAIVIEWPEGSHSYKVMGKLDPDAGVFQGGGKYNEIFSCAGKLHKMSMPLPCWQRLQQGEVVKRWEMIQHDNNTVWSIDMDTARLRREVYRTTEGERIGVPIEYISHHDAAGNPVAGETQPRSVKGLSWEDIDPAAFVKQKPRSKRS